MMNTLQLQLLDATLRRQPVLSVYLALDTTNPLDRRPWLLQLQHALHRARELVASASHTEREQFERGAAHVEQAARALPLGHAGRTWVAFVTPAGVRHSEVVPAEVPTVVAWGEGIRLAPYLRLMNEDLPVVVVVCDAAHADVWECRGGASRVVERIHAHHASAHEPSQMSAAPRPGFHMGTRGAVGRDDLQRQRREATRRMLELVAKRSAQLAGADGLICVGGIAHVASQLAPMIPGPARQNTLRGLGVRATAAQVAAAARDALHDTLSRRDSAGLQETIERAAPSGFGVLGAAEARSAVERGRVKELFVSDRFLQEHLEDAEWGVRHALRQGARVTVLAGDSAARLDEQGGLAAWLRYRLDGSTNRSGRREARQP